MKFRSNSATNHSVRCAVTFTGAVFAAALFCTASAMADSLEVTQLASGYTASSIELGVPYGGSIANNPTNPHLLYVSAGNYGEHTILEVNVESGTTRTLTGIVGNIGGLAVLSNGDLAITENMSSGTILRARDNDADGAYFSEGEITELIAPIGVESQFTGAQVTVAPADNAAKIPAGSLLVQMADGGVVSDILVIQNPETSPTYHPAGAPWYTGFTYNGGIAFSPDGHVLCGISEFPWGRIRALVNTNGNDRIDLGEVYDIVTPDTLINSISDLTATADGKVLTVENGEIVRMFNLPEDLTSAEEVTSSVLTVTNATYMSSVRANFADRHFTPQAPGAGATVYLGGFVSYPAATNLVAITPEPAPASAKGWELLY